MTSSKFDIKAGASPQELINPIGGGASIINRSSTYTVWLDDNPSVAPGFGTPLEPLAQMTLGDGRIWACPDVGQIGTVQVIITDVAGDYSNPVALAAAVALQIAGETLDTNVVQSIDLNVAQILSNVTADIANTVDTNILNALLDVQGQSKIDVLLNQANVAAGGFSAQLDISKYSEVIVVSSVISAAFLYQMFEASTGLVIDEDYVAPITNAGSVFPTAKLAAIGDSFWIQNLDSVTRQFTVFGTNRVPIGRYNVNRDIGLVREWFAASASRTQGNDYTLPYATGLLPFPSGQTFISVECGGSAANPVGGYFWISDPITGKQLRVINNDRNNDSDGFTRNNNVIGWPAYATTVGFHMTKATATGFLRLQAASMNP